jgi:PIN domain nuclease of toxin-antitoxin system
MKLLLDTHVVIWFITDDAKLPLETKNLICSSENTCFVSIASFWEIGIKYALGRLSLRAELSKIFEIIYDSGFLLLPIAPEHILTNALLPFHHRDPFDRLIIAQGKREGYTVISKDGYFNRYDINLLWS